MANSKDKEPISSEYQSERYRNPEWFRQDYSYQKLKEERAKAESTKPADFARLNENVIILGGVAVAVAFLSLSVYVICYGVEGIPTNIDLTTASLVFNSVVTFILYAIVGLIGVVLLLGALLLFCFSGKGDEKFKNISTGFFLLCLSLTCLGQFSQKSVVSNESSKSDIEGAWIAAQKFIKRKLVSPSSASFGSIIDGDYQVAKDVLVSHSGDEYEFSCFVDSQNALGATIRNNVRCKVKISGDNGTLVFLDFQ